jgi:outer membrane protein OmpA-like peptidoglycan-associated protein
MKNFTGCLLLIALFLFTTSFLVTQSKELTPGYYVVVAAYAPSRESMAQKYVEELRKQGTTAEYGYNTSKKLFFVYLKYFTSLKESLLYMTATRKQGKFKDAWVRVVPGYIPALQTTPPPAEVKPQEAVPANGNEQHLQNNNNNGTTPSGTPDSTATAADTIEVTDNPPIVQYNPMTLGNTEVFLSLYNARNNRIVDGYAQVIDTERSKALARVKGNEYLLLPDPKSKSGQLTLICEAFGYRKIQQEINYPLPLADTVKPYIDLMGTTLVVNFDLVRYHKGDIATLYNVYFFNDAAIMRPESTFELGSLLQLLQENPRYRIRLHGHTNGNYHGKMITMGPDKNFFSLDGSKSGMGSAKDLSYNRAAIIKDYLVSKGIAESRVELKAWGGKRPIYDKRGPSAQKNVRVEVEILEE